VTTANSVSNLYPGEAVLIDNGGSTQEIGWICGTISSGSPSSLYIMRSAAATINAHSAATPIYPAGVYVEGILSQHRTGLRSSSSQLLLMGDIDEDGTPVLISYNCTGTTLTRNVWTFNNTTAISSATLLTNASCSFKYSDNDKLISGDNVTIVTAGPSDHLNQYYMVTAVNLYLTATSDTKDSQTGSYFTVTKSYENIQPRNLIYALSSSVNSTQRQWTPTTGTFASSSLP
jgi:hypothetical protein